MIDKLVLLIPEMILFGAAVIAAIMGLSRSKAVRDIVPAFVAVSLAFAMISVLFVLTEQRIEQASLLMPNIGPFVKIGVCAIGILLVMVNAGLADRRLEEAFQSGRAAFDPMRVTRGEFYSFFLLSLMGVMLCCNANDLIWLFLALELTSLPTYIMVTMSRGTRKASEAGMKYFFLGALAAAVFLYGFALLYGATGTIVLTEMRDVFAQQAADGGINALGIFGLIIALLGIAFKLAAAPMHFYAADVYEGAASAVAAFLAFAPKLAGLIAVMLVVGTVGWTGHYEAGIEGLPRSVLTTLWMVAVLTMTLGNIAALLQSSVKRILAYSSVAHSGYMLMGIIAGTTMGLNAALLYMMVYAIMNTAAFAVLAGLERRGREIETLDDLAGLRQRHPAMAWVMAIAAGSLIGLPPLLGFWAKLWLFLAVLEAGHVLLVIIAVLNSAISAWYYLALVKQPLVEKPSPQAETIVEFPSIWPRLAGFIAAAAVLLMPLFIGALYEQAGRLTDGYSDQSSPSLGASGESDEPLRPGGHISSMANVAEQSD